MGLLYRWLVLSVIMIAIIMPGLVKLQLNARVCIGALS